MPNSLKADYARCKIGTSIKNQTMNLLEDTRKRGIYDSLVTNILAKDSGKISFEFDSSKIAKTEAPYELKFES